LIVIVAFLLILGKTRAVGKLFKVLTTLVIIGLVVVAVAKPLMENQIRNVSSPQDAAIIILESLFALIVIMTAIFGFGFTKRLVERLFASFVYDVLKGTFRVFFKGFNRLFELFR
jgi:hypothetical protein